MQTLVCLVKVTNKINEGKGLFTHPISQSDFAVQSYLDTNTSIYVAPLKLCRKY